MPSDPRFDLPIKGDRGPVDRVEDEKPKPEWTYQLNINVTFTDERDARVFTKMFVDGVDSNIKLLSQTMATDNKLEGEAKMNWFVRAFKNRDGEDMF